MDKSVCTGHISSFVITLIILTMLFRTFLFQKFVLLHCLFFFQQSMYADVDDEYDDEDDDDEDDDDDNPQMYSRPVKQR